MRRELKPFRFKRFSISHSNSTIAVGTDAVLLSAWVSVSPSDKVLDIGTGCGLIALGVAQRLGNESIVHALDIDFESVKEASFNFNKSEWRERLTAFYSNYQSHLLSGYDLIISNPPFFRDSQKNEKDFLEKARHQVIFEMRDFARYCMNSSGPSGKIALVYPAQDLEFLKGCFLQQGFFLSRLCTVFSKEKKKASRVLVEFSKDFYLTVQEKLVIYTDQNEYTPAYRELTEDYYLNF